MKDASEKNEFQGLGLAMNKPKRHDKSKLSFFRPAHGWGQISKEYTRLACMWSCTWCVCVCGATSAACTASLVVSQHLLTTSLKVNAVRSELPFWWFLHTSSHWHEGRWEAQCVPHERHGQPSFTTVHRNNVAVIVAWTFFCKWWKVCQFHTLRKNGSKTLLSLKTVGRIYQ